MSYMSKRSHNEGGERSPKEFHKLDLIEIASIFISAS